jgi:hypothetical protein
LSEGALHIIRLSKGESLFLIVEILTISFSNNTVTKKQPASSKLLPSFGTLFHTNYLPVSTYVHMYLRVICSRKNQKVNITTVFDSDFEPVKAINVEVELVTMAVAVVVRVVDVVVVVVGGGGGCCCCCCVVVVMVVVVVIIVVDAVVVDDDDDVVVVVDDVVDVDVVVVYLVDDVDVIVVVVVVVVIIIVVIEVEDEEEVVELA